jgi:hypothetical protein
MKKIIFFLGIIALLNANVLSVGRPIHGYIGLVTIPANDSAFCQSVCIYGGSSGTKAYIQIDSIIEMNSVKIGIDQTMGLMVKFKIYANYYAYGHFRDPIYFPISSFIIDNIDVFGGIDLETQLPLLIKNGLATALNINSTRITITSYYYNYPSF